MTQPQDPRKQPLQDDEIALARVLRSLPAGEPSASVDAAILRAATDAASPGRRRPARGLPWLPTWAIGTAAAAVLAVGIGTQLRPPLAPEASPASMSEAVKPMPQARERLSVELIEPDQAQAPPPASAPPESRQATRTRTPPPPLPEFAPPPAPPAPEAPAAEPRAFPAPQPAAPAAEAPALGANNQAAAIADSAPQREGRLRSGSTDQARRLQQEAYARRAEAKASAEAEVDARAGASVAASAAPQEAMAAADAAMEPPVLPPSADDARLEPDAWLERIRERLRQGDRAGARASLGLFVQAYPEAQVPSDLAPLR